jgi:hypothetical protein
MRNEPVGVPLAPCPLPELAELAVAVRAWTERGRPDRLRRWLERELDAEGVPRRLPPAAWRAGLTALAEAWDAARPDWPEALVGRVKGLVWASLRFSRPDGSAVFGPEGAAPEFAALIYSWSERLAEPALATALQKRAAARADGLSPRKPKRSAEPPSVSDAPAGRLDRPLAVLRADWARRGDYLAIDHRDPCGPGLVELSAAGRRWLGPEWISGEGTRTRARAQLICWLSQKRADLAEWSFGTPDGRVVRTALWIKDQHLALLADEVDGPVPSALLRVAVAPEIEPIAVSDLRAFQLAAGRGLSARVLPLGLPSLPYATDRGSLGVEGRFLALRQRVEGRRAWLPLLVSWRPGRNRRPTRWRLLTVSEHGAICPPDVAFAARIGWGSAENLILYRSLARPASRVFLGHQTRARFLVGWFTRTGEVEPIITVES